MSVRCELSHGLRRNFTGSFGQYHVPKRQRKVAPNPEVLGEALDALTAILRVVDEDDIAEVVAQWTGIPVNQMMETESEKLH